MSRSKSSKLSAERKHVQRHRVVRVTLKKFLFSIFLNFLCQTPKKNTRCRAILLSPLGRNVVSLAVKKSLGQSCPSCLRKLNVVVLIVTVRETF